LPLQSDQSAALLLGSENRFALSSNSAASQRQNDESLARALHDERTKRAHTPVGVSSRARNQPTKQKKTRITPEDRPLDVRVFLAALAAGKGVPEAAGLAELSTHRIARWVAFCDFLPAIRKAQRKGKRYNSDGAGEARIDALIELSAALEDRTEQRAADQYADGDRERLLEMQKSGELQAIHDREAIANLRWHGKHDLADHYERLMAEAPLPPPIDYVGEALRSLGLE
jgi:hypothetical protein